MKKFQNVSLSKNNMIINWVSVFASFIIWAICMVSLVRGTATYGQAILSFAFFLFEPQIKELCYDKMSIKANDGYLNLSDTIRRAAEDAMGTKSFRIKCNEIVEYSGFCNPTTVVTVDEVIVTLDKVGTTSFLRIDGQLSGEKIYHNIVKF